MRCISGMRSRPRLAIGVGIGMAAGAASYAAETAGFSWGGLAGSAAIGGATGLIPGELGVGARVAAAGLVARAIPASTAAWKIDGFHRVGAWVADTIATRGGVSLLTSTYTGKIGVQVSVAARVNGRAGVQQWIISAGGSLTRNSGRSSAV